MAGILDGLNTAKMALSAQQYAITITQRNAANVNNPNYTRQDLFFTDPTAVTNWTASGVPGVTMSAARNRYLDYSISREFSEFRENYVKHNALLEIDAILRATGGGGLGTSISEFFNSFTELSSNPTDSALRWQVVSRANTMAQDFERIYDNITRVKTSSEQQIVRGLDEVNNLTAKIADLNERAGIAKSRGDMETEAALTDERQMYLEELQGKIGILYFEHYDTETDTISITVTTTRGDAIVLGNRSFALTASVTPTDTTINLNGTGDVTKTIESGEIGGHLQMVNDLIPEYLNRLNAMAVTIITNVNSMHNGGMNLDGEISGATGFVQDFFTGTYASDIAVNIDDPKKVVAADDTAAIGDNSIAVLLGELGKTLALDKDYAELVYKVGSDQREAKEAIEKQQNVLNQLLDQRNSESGVSFNEEAINLIRFQRAYQASAQFVSVLNTLSAEILQIVR